MSKGTPAKGRRTGKKSHIRCRRCGRHSYHFQNKRCAHCGYPDKKMRSYNWQNKKYGKRSSKK